MNLNKQDALALLKEVTEVVAPSQVKGILSGIDKWGQTLGPYPFARPYYWGAFQALGSPEAVFNGQRN
jgi:CHAT domain-containing protein